MIIRIKKLHPAKAPIPQGADERNRRREKYRTNQENKYSGQPYEQLVAQKNALNAYASYKITNTVIIRHKRAKKPRIIPVGKGSFHCFLEAI